MQYVDSARGLFRTAARWAFSGGSRPSDASRHSAAQPQYNLLPTDGAAGVPHILVLSASVGSGHVRAAEAIVSALRTLAPAAFVHHVDILTQTNRFFRRAMDGGYFQLVQRSPHLLGYLYDRLDGHESCFDRPSDRLRILWERLNLSAVTRLLLHQPWDLIINTHFTAAAMVSSLRQARWLTTPFATVVTDYDVHRLWITPQCDLYFTATQEAQAAVMSRQVPSSRIAVSGIPIDTAFARHLERDTARMRLRLFCDLPVVVQMAGGGGIGPIELVHQGLLSLRRPVQIVACAGRNQAVCKRLLDIPCPPHHRRQVLGFTDQIPALLAAADLLVSKPGGLTVSEAMACGVGLVIVDPIPGQESCNADFVLEQGFGFKVNNLAALGQKVQAVLDDEQRLASLRARAVAAARPWAALEVARRCLELAHAPVGRA